MKSRMTEERRRRRRKISSVIKPEEQKPLLPVEESSAEGRTNESRRRSRRITSAESEGETKPTLLPEEWSEEEISEVFEQRKGSRQLVMTSEVDQIKAELVEERSSALLESNYWDETHSWGSDDEEGSDEYWHFLGRYE